MSLFSRKSSILAISLEDAAIRIAAVSAEEGQKANVTEHSMVDVPAGVIVRQRIVKPDECTQLLQKALAGIQHTSGVMVCALPAGLVYTLAHVGLTESPTAKKPLATVLADALPLSPEKLTTHEEWTPPSGKTPGTWSCLAIEKEVLDSYKNLFKKAGLSSVSFLSLSQALLSMHAKEQPAIVLNLTMHPMSVTYGMGKAILGERILFEGSAQESFAEAIQPWMMMSSKEHPLPVMALGDEGTAKTLFSKTASMQSTTIPADEWYFGHILAHAQLLKPLLHSF